MMIGAVAWRKALPDLLCRRLWGCVGRSGCAWHWCSWRDFVGRAAVSDGALGSVLDAATKYTPAPIMRLAGALHGAAGAGAGEAAVTGATNGAQAYQEVMDAPIESLRKSPAFQSLSKELGSEDAARKAIADRMSIQTAKDTALSTGLIGAAMGGGAVGSLLNKFAVKQGRRKLVGQAPRRRQRKC